MTPEEIEWLEKYISSLPWSTEATDKDKTLVAGNLRAFYREVTKRMDREQAVIVRLKKKNSELWDDIIDLKLKLKSIKGKQ